MGPLERPLPPLAELARDLERGAVGDGALVEHAIEQHRPELHAYRCFDLQGARRGARRAAELRRAGRARALTGVPISVKDLYGVPGFDTFAGCPEPLPERFQRVGPLVRELLGQGAVVVGKTHTVQFAFGGLGTNPHFPDPINPWDSKRKRVAGGSSSGAGVSLCEGSALLAVGTDTAGSVRIPAAMTGNAALKVTVGRWPTEGIVPLSPTLDTPGLLARSAADLAWAWRALEPSAPAPSLSSLYGVSLVAPEEPSLWSGCSAGVAEAVEAALSELSGSGASIARRPWPDASRALELFREHSPAPLELGVFLREQLPGCLERLDPNVAARLELEAGAAELSRRVAAHRGLAEQASPSLRAVDAVVFPTVPLSAPTLAELVDPQAYRRCNALALRNTSVANFLGLCAVTLPVGLDRLGLPVGLQLVGAAGTEARVLAVAVAVERALGPLAERFGPPPRVAWRP